MKQQSLAPVCYPPRAPVGDALQWSDGLYRPPEFEAGVLHQSKTPGWADVPHVYDQILVGERLCYDEETKGRTTVLLKCHFDSVTQRFKNPQGKTGIRGRGELGRWGPNHAADTIVTRTKEDGTHQALLCTKNVGDGQSFLCWPAGMVEPGQTVAQTLRAELTQEALEDSDVVDRLFAECDEGTVHAGHVDDWRNTDDAWIETVAQHFHATEDIASQLVLGVSDTQEIKNVAWYDMDSVDNMYASHLGWLKAVLAKLQEESPSPSKRSKTGSSTEDVKTGSSLSADVQDAHDPEDHASVSVVSNVVPMFGAIDSSPKEAVREVADSV